MAQVNPPPILRRPPEFVNDQGKDAYFRALEWILFQLWNKTGAGDDSTESPFEEQGLDISSVFAQLLDARDRIGELEDWIQQSDVNAKISQVNARIDELIDLLIEEIKKVQPNEERESKKLALQRNLLHEIKLLNARIEEAFETDLEDNDV